VTPLPRLTQREWAAIDEALSRCLAGEPESDDEDVDGMELAQVKVRAYLRDAEAS